MGYGFLFNTSILRLNLRPAMQFLLLGDDVETDLSSILVKTHIFQWIVNIYN